MLAKLLKTMTSSSPALTAVPHPTHELVMYSRSMPCPFVTVAKRSLAGYCVPYRTLLIDQDPTARERVIEWTGFLSVPTLVIALPDSNLPYAVVAPLPVGKSPRGVHRGVMITEPSHQELTEWLKDNGFLA